MTKLLDEIEIFQERKEVSTSTSSVGTKIVPFSVSVLDHHSYKKSLQVGGNFEIVLSFTIAAFGSEAEAGT